MIDHYYKEQGKKWSDGQTYAIGEKQLKNS
jgi:hypothetical protein